MRARYQEFDTIANAQLETDAAAVLADRIGPTVALTNSAGGLRALLTAMKSDKIIGIVAYENVGCVYPEGEAPDVPPGPFGPIEVPLEEFRKLTRIPMQMVWGDNVDKSDRYRPTLVESRRWVELVNKHGGKAEVLVLPDAGLTRQHAHPVRGPQQRRGRRPAIEVPRASTASTRARTEREPSATRRRSRTARRRCRASRANTGRSSRAPRARAR